MTDTEYRELSGEQDPTERMTEQQEQARERAEDEENHRDADHEGEMQTEEFDLAEALSNV